MTPNNATMINAQTDSRLPSRRLACARCGTAFECGVGGRDGGCWCMDETVRMPIPESGSEDCLCPACFRMAAAGPAGRSA